MSRRTASQSEIAERCVILAAELLNVVPSRIVRTTKFSRLGLDSATSINLILSLEEWLGVQIAPEAVFDYPTVEALADHLSTVLPELAEVQQMAADDFDEFTEEELLQQLSERLG